MILAKRASLILTLIWVLTVSLSGQLDSLTNEHNKYFSKIDTLKIDVVKNQNEHLAFVQYRLKPKNTLYSISKYFNVQTGEILKYNPQLTQKLPQLGDILQIPIKINSLDDQAISDQSQLPVFYTVKKGETLYTISKIYFNTPLSEFTQRAGLESVNLTPDQKLFLGYLNLSPMNDDENIVKDTITEDSKVTDRFMQAYGHLDIKSEKGIAFWRSRNATGKTFALHREAKVGSALEITNPMFDTKIYAKVVGRLPKGAYTDDIMVVLSPKAAKALGALDPKFFVKVRYIK